MKLEIIVQAETFEKIKEAAERHFGHELRLIPETQSIFTSWIMRPVKRIFIAGIWKYRIIFRQGKYYLGTIC